MNRYVLQLLALVAGLVMCTGVVAQPFADEKPLPEADNYFVGITILGNPSLGFSTLSDYRNGVTVNHTTLRLNVLLGVAWSLEVRATGNLQYQTNQIPISNIGLQSTNLGVRPEIFLSTTNQLLASGIANLLLNQNMTIRYRALGGNNFLKPSGNYTTSLIFTYSGL